LLLLFGDLLVLVGESTPELLVFALYAVIFLGRRFTTGWSIAGRTTAGQRKAVQAPTHATTVIENLCHVQRHEGIGYLICHAASAPATGELERRSISVKSPVAS